MKIAILTLKPSLYSTRRLADAGEKRGHQMHVIDYMRCCININSDKPSVMYEGQNLEKFDAIIPRIVAAKTQHLTAVVRQFEMMGVFAANSSLAISRSCDKLRCLQILASKKIGLPFTGLAHSPEDIGSLLELVGGPPVVIKLLQGSQGIGVVLAETLQAAKSIVEAFQRFEANILVQEFIKEAGAADIRCYAIGDKVVASMKRQAAPGEFRSNLHRGGTAEKIKLTPQERSTALRAAKAMGLNIAGVDIVRSDRGPLVLEVNSSPGLEGIETVTGIDVAGKTIEFLEKNMALGKIDDRSQY